MADGYGEKRVAWEEKRKRREKIGKKKRKRKEKKRAGLARKRQDTDMGPQYEYIYKNVIVTLFP